MQHKQDKQLVKQLLKGQTQAFNTFFDSYHSKLFRFILGRVDGDHDLAMDLAQETLCKALDNLKDYRAEAALFTWMCQIARSFIYAHFSKQKRRRRHVVPMAEHPSIRKVLLTIADGQETQPELQLHNQQIQQLIEEVLDHLPNNYGDLLTWKYIDELSVAEMAERANTTMVAIQSALARARQSFQQAFTALLKTDSLDHFYPSNWEYEYE
ncbi:RNA polymerase sigma factor [Marinicella gelatinilytica]|uniref:RNA polymerase sigma factor n=1 Tax=Marinicella gelatinilytica TaxID=2996017 RepID=UPI002260B7A8|nr:RNA polymerase sigma factor [Marinicella gelatinilytica]MCX7544700.1 RNA polymerase sigma factor [Marinicella gelatinilytica]